MLKHPDATPAQINSAAKWLLFIETGKRLPTEGELPTPSSQTPLQPSTVEPNSVVSNPVIGPDDGDPMMAAILNKLKV